MTTRARTCTVTRDHSRRWTTKRVLVETLNKHEQIAAERRRQKWQASTLPIVRCCRVPPSCDDNRRSNTLSSGIGKATAAVQPIFSAHLSEKKRRRCFVSRSALRVVFRLRAEHGAADQRRLAIRQWRHDADRLLLFHVPVGRSLDSLLCADHGQVKHLNANFSFSEIKNKELHENGQAVAKTGSAFNWNSQRGQLDRRLSFSLLFLYIRNAVDSNSKKKYPAVLCSTTC